MSDNIIVARDRNNKILKNSGIENWNKILKDFKECMNRKGHGGVLAENDYEEPIEPVAALNRLRGVGGAPPLPTDQRDKADLVKAIKFWKISCVTVLCSLLNVMTKTIISRIQSTDLELEIASKENITLIIEWLNNEYGNWSDIRGTRNYDEMKAIPYFKSIESTHEGLRKLKLLRDERMSWNEPIQLFSDAFYKNWLLLRMENWDKLDFERNIIEKHRNHDLR